MMSLTNLICIVTKLFETKKKSKSIINIHLFMNKHIFILFCFIFFEFENINRKMFFTKSWIIIMKTLIQNFYMITMLYFLIFEFFIVVIIIWFLNVCILYKKIDICLLIFIFILYENFLKYENFYVTLMFLMF